MQIIQESNIEKLINKVALEIYDAATLGEEEIYLNQPYFKSSRENKPNIPFDPFRQGIKEFDYQFVLNDMKRYVTYHINKTLGIVSDHPYGHNDPMVAPIAERLTNAFYKDALRMGYVEENSNIDKQSWYSGSVIKYHLDETIIDETIKESIGKRKIILTEEQYRRVILEEDTISESVVISPSDRIHYSPNPITDHAKQYSGSKNYNTASHEAGKPTGLWYGFGTDWKSHMTAGLSDDRISQNESNFKYIYKITIGPGSNIYKIDKNSVQEFERRYGVPHPVNEGWNVIDWGKVKKDGYDGVELVDRRGAMANSIYVGGDGNGFPWYSWDINSGIVWNPGVIEFEQILPKNKNTVSDKKETEEYCGNRPFYNCFDKAIDEWWNDDEAKNWIELFKKDGFDTAISSILNNSWNSLENQAELVADLTICYTKCESKLVKDAISKIGDLTIGDILGKNIVTSAISYIKKWWDNDDKNNLNEAVDWSDKGDNKYHRNGMVNKIVGDFLKMIELDTESLKFRIIQHMADPVSSSWTDPYLTYVYDENGLTKESKDLLYEGLTNGVKWYMEHTGLIDYHHPHDNTRPPEDEELIKMIVDTLHPLVIKAIIDYNEDEGWTKDTLYDSKFLAESLGNFKNRSKQEQYVNYVLKHIMDNTKWADASYSQLLLNDRISMSTYINYGDFEFSWVPDDVRTVLKEMGLNAEELSDVWDIYSSWVLEKIMREGNVNWPNRENHKKRFPFMVTRFNESTMDIDRVLDNSSKLAEKLAKEIIDASVLSGKLLNFYPPVVEEDKHEGPISADVNSEWIHNDSSTGVYHLTDDIRRVGRNYINNILQLGLDRNDPLFSQVNNIVIDNILQRARNHNWMKEVGGMRDLKDKHGFIQESVQPKYLDKIYNSLIKELEFDAGKYGAVIIPFINSENYSSESGELEMGEYKLPKHDRNIRLRDDGILHREFRSYLHEIYGLSVEEANEVFGMVRQYIKSELYYRSVLQQILIDVQDDYIQGYGAKVDITPERTIDLKNYDDFKEYVDWWHGIVEPDYDNDGVADVSDNMVKRLYDEIWGILKDSITLTEGWPADPDVEIIDGEEYVTSDKMFPDKFYQKIFKMIDKDPEFFMTEILRNLGFEQEEEYDILYNYFVNYSDRKDYYVDFKIDPQDIASFFQDRDYGMEEMVKNYLEGNWDPIEWYTESFQFDDYMLGHINDGSWGEIAKILKVDNIADAEELVSGNIGNEKLEDHYELMETTIEDIQSIIAHSMTEAQADADMAYLHEDILSEVNDFFKHGKFNFEQGEFVGSVELGGVFEKDSNGMDMLDSHLKEGYPTLEAVVLDTLYEELNDWGYQDEYVFTGDEKPNINTDKHFRYGGAGTLNDIHFNDMFVDRLSWDY